MTEIKPQPGPQEKFLASTADITIYGGAAGGGKTFAELLEPLRHVDNPRFEALILRRTNKEVLNPGGLWSESEGIYPLVGAEARIGSLEWRFPSGARVKFDHIEHESDKFKYQGGQIPLIEFDELTHFTEGQFWYLLSRNRSTCGVRPYVRATCNPEPGWVADLIAWWIDEATGLPIAERAGVVRWFVRVAGRLVWGDTPEELKAANQGCEPKSLTFIPARLEDNPALLAKDPGYRANLLNLPSVEQQRLLYGNWKVTNQDGAEWGPDCFLDLWSDEWPTTFDVSAIAIDPSKGKSTGDYAAIVFVGFAAGRLWVDAVVARMSAARIAAESVELYRSLLPTIVGIESNANQDLAFGSLITQAAAERHLPPLPMVPIENREAKERRIYRLGPYLHNHNFRFRQGSAGCRLLEEQLRGFPLKGAHDDAPDALEMALRLLNQAAAAKAGSLTDQVTEYAA